MHDSHFHVFSGTPAGMIILHTEEILKSDLKHVIELQLSATNLGRKDFSGIVRSQIGHACISIHPSTCTHNMLGYSFIFINDMQLNVQDYVPQDLISILI